MAKGAYIGIGGTAKKIKKIYIGVGSVAKKVKKAYIGDANDIARLWWTAQPVLSKSSCANVVAQTATGTYLSYLRFNGTTFNNYACFGVSLKTQTRYNSSLTRETTVWPETSVCTTGGFSHTSDYCFGASSTGANYTIVMDKSFSISRYSSSSSWRNYVDSNFISATDLQTNDYAFMFSHEYDGDEYDYYGYSFDNSATGSIELSDASKFAGSSSVISFNNVILDISNKSGLVAAQYLDNSKTYHIGSYSFSWPGSLSARSAHTNDYVIYFSTLLKGGSQEDFSDVFFTSCDKSYTFNNFKTITNTKRYWYDATAASSGQWMYPSGGNLPNSCVFGGGAVYNYSGSSWGPLDVNDTYAFDNNLTQIECPAFSTARSYHARGSVGQYLIFAGGSTNDTNIMTTEVYKES